jgi:phosphoglycerate dehydrogenase-like enzyme
VGDPTPSVLVAPAGTQSYLAEAVREGGGRPLVPGDGAEAESAEAVVWADHRDPDGLATLLDAHPDVRWVQLPWAGVEPYLPVIRAHADRTWTCAKGIYSEPVAEHALALTLAGFRGLGAYARVDHWTGQRGRNLRGAPVTVLGAGGIARSFLRLLEPFGADVTVVRSTGDDPVPGATRVVPATDTDTALTGVELVVLALPLTDETRGIIDAHRLGLLARGACLVNVARGEHVVTDDLMDALRDGHLGFAGLDVTDPEPLPDGHGLWSLAGALVTPHTANTQAMAVPLLRELVTDNVRRWTTGQPLRGPVDPVKGY